ncbi:protein ADP-ribosylarginine hydrolase isoform X2 [Aplysia californica]|uniref:ADP-ribosylhydrolase ARH1 n=1 Tax=Aplysia californica TaxID=6500 RepID=A0ABM0K8U6_APLCA|nr:protein ADP-ribosylarginine hydrolase isoform X2 [Aplysia californica]
MSYCCSLCCWTISKTTASASVDMESRYVSAMVLSGVGDAIGYKDGEWEFCHNGSRIFAQLQSLGGLDKIVVKLPGWMVSDDTVMHLATADALIESSREDDMETLLLSIARHYKQCMKDMAGRAPGNTCRLGTSQLRPAVKKGYRIPFNPRGGGCGAAMRAMCIGLRYPRPDQLDTLICVSVESGRMTHHNPVGFLGSLASALLTAYAVQGRPIQSWGQGLMETLPKALDYIRSSEYCVSENEEAWGYFEKKWQDYLELRGLTDGKSEAKFPEQYGFAERDQFVKSVSFSGWGGASGHDAPMIAYDALLGAGDNWSELCNRGMFHGGDSDSTGVMAGCWFGVLYGYKGVPNGNYSRLEYRKRLETAGEKLYKYAFPDADSEKDQPVMAEAVKVTVEEPAASENASSN